MLVFWHFAVQAMSAWPTVTLVNALIDNLFIISLLLSGKIKLIDWRNLSALVAKWTPTVGNKRRCLSVISDTATSGWLLSLNWVRVGDCSSWSMSFKDQTALYKWYMRDVGMPVMQQFHQLYSASLLHICVTFTPWIKAFCCCVTSWWSKQNSG